jgi:cytochrome c
MIRTIFALVIAALNFATFTPALAAEFGTREEAIAMVKRVQQKFRRDGAEATFKSVTGQARIFHDRHLYPFVYDMNGVVVAHGAKADLVGKNLIDFKDQDGRFVIQQMIAVVKNPGSGWIDLRWTGPTTKEVEAKSSYVERMGQYWAGVGVLY